MLTPVVHYLTRCVRACFELRMRGKFSWFEATPASQSSCLLMFGYNHEKDLSSTLGTLKHTTASQWVMNLTVWNSVKRVSILCSYKVVSSQETPWIIATNEFRDKLALSSTYLLLYFPRRCEMSDHRTLTWHDYGMECKINRQGITSVI